MEQPSSNVVMAGPDDEALLRANVPAIHVLRCKTCIRGTSLSPPPLYIRAIRTRRCTDPGNVQPRNLVPGGTSRGFGYCGSWSALDVCVCPHCSDISSLFRSCWEAGTPACSG